MIILVQEGGFVTTIWQKHCQAWFEAFVASKPRPVSIERARAHYEEWVKSTGICQFVNADHPEKGERRLIGSVGGIPAIMSKVVPTLCASTPYSGADPVAYTILGSLRAAWVAETGQYYIQHIVPFVDPDTGQTCDHA